MRKGILRTIWLFGGAIAARADSSTALPTPQTYWNFWGSDPGVIVSLVALLLLYAQGLAALWGNGQVGRGIKRWQGGCFALGWFSLVAAMVSPLHPLGRVLFTAHMVQHELLMLVAAPLLVLGRPMLVMMASIGRWRRAWKFLKPVARVERRAHSLLRKTPPAAAWIVHALALWIWHLPALFQAAVSNEAVHALQHFCFLGSGLIFWWAIIYGAKKRASYGAGVLYLFTTAAHSGVLGAMLTLGSAPWYPAYESTAPLWGMTALEDQQLGGLIMWIPAGLVYIAAALILFAFWLKESERRAPQLAIISAT
jgi:putative membrane protein